MTRLSASAALLALIVLVGCSKPDSGTDSGPTKEPSPVGAKSTDHPAAGKKTPPVEATEPEVLQLQPKARFRTDKSEDRTIQVSADGSRVALSTSGQGGVPFVQVWQLSGEPKVLFESPKNYGGGALALSPSGKRVLVSGGSTVYEVDTRKKIAKPPVVYFSHAFFKDEDTVVCTQASHNLPKRGKGRITVWDVARDKDAGSFDVPDDRFLSAFPARNGSEIWLFQAGDRFEVACYDIAQKQLRQTLKPEPGSQPFVYSSTAVAPDGSAFAANVSSMRVYDGQTGKAVWQMPRGLAGLTNGLVAGGSRCLATRYNPDKTQTLVACDWRTGKVLAALSGFPADHKEILGSASADGKTIVAVSKQGEALVFDVSAVQ